MHIINWNTYKTYICTLYVHVHICKFSHILNLSKHTVNWTRYPGNLHNHEEVIQLQLNRMLKYMLIPYETYYWSLKKYFNVFFFLHLRIIARQKVEPKKAVPLVSSLTTAGIYTKLSRRPQLHFYSMILRLEVGCFSHGHV